jgi:hypothetical protein
MGRWKRLTAIKEEGLWWDPLVYPSIRSVRVAVRKKAGLFPNG